MDTNNTNGLGENKTPTLDNIVNENPLQGTVEVQDDMIIDRSGEEQFSMIMDTSVGESPVVQPVFNQTPVIESIDDIATQDVVEEKVEDNVAELPNDDILEPQKLEDTVSLMGDFDAVPLPPEFDSNNKLKVKNKQSKRPIVIVLLAVLVFAVGLGVYFLLVGAKGFSKKSITPKEIHIELGSSLSSRVEDYAVISGYNKKNCSIDLNTVDSSKVNTYEYTVTCKKAKAKGLVIVEDTTPPVVTPTDLIIVQNSPLNADDFIEQCVDASSCSYQFKTNVEGLTGILGEYDVEILVTDEYNNQTSVFAKLTVATTAPSKYLTCKNNEETIDELGATLVTTYRVGLDAQDNFHSAVRTSEFKFNNIDNYHKSITTFTETNSLNNRSGSSKFDEVKMSIALKENKTLNDMNNDLKGKLPTNANILRAYLSGLGYACN